MLSTIRQEDVLCRVGGEEFAMITGDATAGGAAALAERLRKAIEQAKFAHRGTQISVTCSFGVAQSGGTYGANPNIAEQADAALYMAKRMGRNQVQVADQPTSDKSQREQTKPRDNVVTITRPISAIH
jgi:diguanylate cyclase